MVRLTVVLLVELFPFVFKALFTTALRRLIMCISAMPFLVFIHSENAASDQDL